MPAIAPTAFSGAATFQFGTGSSINGTFNFTAITLSLDREGKGEFSANVESDGACNIVWDETTGTTADIYGTNGSFTAPTGINAKFDGFSLTVNNASVSYLGFGENWRGSKLVGANITGSVTGRLQYQNTTTTPLPTTS